MRVPSGDQAGARSSTLLDVSFVWPVPSTFITQISAVIALLGLSPALWRVNAICCPTGDQSASASIVDGLFEMFFGGVSFSSQSSRLRTKMALSVVAAPGS